MTWSYCPVGKTMGHFLDWLLMWEDTASLGWNHCWAVVLECIRKQAVLYHSNRKQTQIWFSFWRAHSSLNFLLPPLQPMFLLIGQQTVFKAAEFGIFMCDVMYLSFPSFSLPCLALHAPKPWASLKLNSGINPAAVEEAGWRTSAVVPSLDEGYRRPQACLVCRMEKMGSTGSPGQQVTGLGKRVVGWW